MSEAINRAEPAVVSAQAPTVTVRVYDWNGTPHDCTGDADPTFRTVLGQAAILAYLSNALGVKKERLYLVHDGSVVVDPGRSLTDNGVIPGSELEVSEMQSIEMQDQRCGVAPSSELRRWRGLYDVRRTYGCDLRRVSVSYELCALF